MLSLSVDIWRPVVSGGSQSLTAQVQALFAGGKVGGMWDMGDTSTLYQQHINGGTTFNVVTAAGQQIGAALDKSKQSTWTDNTGSTWTKSSGDGVVTVVGNVITITGATTTTRVDRAGGTIPFAPGVAQINVTASWSVATGPAVWCRGSVTTTPNGSAITLTSALNNSALERVQIDSGTATFTINSLKYWKGNTATQSTPGSRPLYQVVSGYGCAQFDGAADYLSCGNINLSATDKVTIVAATTLAASGNCGLVGFGNSAAGSFNVGYFSGNATWRASLYGSTGNAQTGISPSDFPAIPHTKVVTVEFDLAGAASTDEAKFRLNGATVTTNHIIGPAGSGNLANAALEIGRAQGVFVFNGNVHRLVVIGGGLSVAERRIVETYAAEGNGQTIP